MLKKQGMKRHANEEGIKLNLKINKDKETEESIDKQIHKRDKREQDK